MRLGAIICAAWLACGGGLCPAVAQEAVADANGSPVQAASATEAGDSQTEAPLTAEESAVLDRALTFEPDTSANLKPGKPLRLPTLDAASVSHSSKADGSGTLVLNRPLIDDWDAKLGADLRLAASAYGPDRLTTPMAQDSGTAWASLGLPNVASVDARVDPTADQGKLATTFKRSIPVGRVVAVTLQDSYSVTQTVGAPAAAPSVLPLMTAPQPTAAPTPQIWGNQKTIKLDVLSTGTTFGAGVNTASNDPVTHNSLSADQKLYGPLHVTTAFNDIGEVSASKSITAALKLDW